MEKSGLLCGNLCHKDSWKTTSRSRLVRIPKGHVKGWVLDSHLRTGRWEQCASRGSSPAPGELLALIPGVNFPVSYVLLTGLKWKQRADMVAEGTVEVLLGLSREQKEAWFMYSTVSPDTSLEPRSESVRLRILYLTLRKHRCRRLLQCDVRCSQLCLQQCLAHGSSRMALLAAEWLGTECPGCWDMRGGQNGVEMGLT